MSQHWASNGLDENEGVEEQVTRIVSGLLKLAHNEEARKLLGIEGTLEDNLDVTFLDDPLGWIASDIAEAIRLQDEEEEESVNLSTVIASLRLYELLEGEVTEEALRTAVLEALEQEEGEEEAE